MLDRQKKDVMAQAGNNWARISCSSKKKDRKKEKKKERKKEKKERKERK